MTIYQNAPRALSYHCNGSAGIYDPASCLKALWLVRLSLDAIEDAPCNSSSFNAVLNAIQNAKYHTQITSALARKSLESRVIQQLP